ncbi:MAG: hypothetical protein IT521_02140 [Burkholderiales bacterium]|nr:hypothetical protein [Burkholderiales bacterium]
MRSIPRVIPLLRSLAAVLLLAFAAVRPAAAVDWTDLWWNSNESGWGVNFVQADDFVFATFFVNGANQQSIWYTGQMTVDANGIWSGPLYQTTGPYYGGIWDPTQRTTTQVGTVTFTPQNSYSGTLTYNVNNVNVTKTVARQTLKSIPLGGKYSGAYLSIFSNCDDPANNGPVRTFVDIEVIQTTGGTLQMDISTSPTAVCRLAGDYFQDGQLYRVPGASYTCGSAFASTANLTQVKATAQGIEGQWVAPIEAGCVESAYFSAVLL